MTKLTEGDRHLIAHFWQDRGDITRWCRWEELLPVIQEEIPELVKAHNDYIAARRILDLVVESVVKDL